MHEAYHRADWSTNMLNLVEQRTEAEKIQSIRYENGKVHDVGEIVAQANSRNGNRLVGGFQLNGF